MKGRPAIQPLELWCISLSRPQSSGYGQTYVAQCPQTIIKRGRSWKGVSCNLLLLHYVLLNRAMRIKAAVHFVLTLPLLASLQRAKAEAPQPPIECIPPSSALVVEVLKPKALLEPLLAPEIAKAVSTFSGTGAPNPKLQELRNIISYLETQTGTDWRTGLRELLGRAVLAIDTSGGAVLVLDTQNEKLLNQLEGIIRQFATTEAENQNQPERVSSRVQAGLKTWSLGPNEAHAIVTNRLFLANRAEPLHRVLGLSAAKGQSITSSPYFRVAAAEVGSDAVARVFLNLGSLKDAPGVKKALADPGNPVAMLLLGDNKEALRNANWLALGAYVRDGKLILRTFTDGKAPESAKAASFCRPNGAEEGVYPDLVVPGNITSLSLFRDLRSFYAAKDDLFPERTSGLVFFENMMGIFFSGIDLTEGVLGQLKPDIRVVVAMQKYDPAIGTPQVQVPAFAAVLHLRDAQKFGETVEEAWQKALGLVNFTRGQKALPGLVIDRDSHAGVKYTVSYYRPPTEKETAPVEPRYNYRPSFARVGDYVVISSTDGLAKDLIDALKKESAKPVKPSQAGHTLGEIDGEQLRAILAANRENMVQDNMLKKGDSREKAENDVAFLLAALGFVDKATFTVGRENGSPQANVELSFKRGM